jgi:hypothetical protein
MNWVKEKSRAHAAKYSWAQVAPGWTPVEEVARQLGVKVREVREELRPGLELGNLQVRTFRVWEDGEFVKKDGWRKALAGGEEVKKSNGKVGHRKAKVEVKPGMQVMARKHGGRGKVVSVKAGRVTICWESVGERACKLSAFERGDVLLA